MDKISVNDTILLKNLKREKIGPNNFFS